MQRLNTTTPLPLLGVAATRALEQNAAHGLPPHALMARAGDAVARWARALYPHTRHLWIACGPGNNGGDGLVAAAALLPWARASGAQLSVSWCGDETRLPADAAWALAQARTAGVTFTDGPAADTDLAIDALLGLGARPVDTQDGSRLGQWQRWLHHTPVPVLCVDLPSGLDADTGTWNGPLPAGPRHTLSLLSLKPGLLTARGRDACGDLWWDDLGVASDSLTPDAWLNGWPATDTTPGAHASHKGSRGDVVVIGGQGLQTGGAGMAGAALLAGQAALHAGAGRVFVALLGHHPATLPWDPATPELMLRTPERLWQDNTLVHASVVCGCGGGEAVREVLPHVLDQAARLVLDADALNHLATDADLQAALRTRAAREQVTVLTPHPLEAGRLLGTTSAQVQANRLHAARELAARFQCVVVLKGSGTVMAAPDRPLVVNPTGNARLATAGTGDVLAGLLGAALAAPGVDVWPACCAAVHQHGHQADTWPAAKGTLTAAALARRLSPPASARPGPA